MASTDAFFDHKNLWSLISNYSTILWMAKTSVILTKRLLRTFRSSFKQFMALLGIGALAMTLYIGLTSNANSLADRVEQVYTSGNMADIYVTTDAYQEDDLTKIQELADKDASGAVVEARTELTAILRGKTSYCVIASSIGEEEMTVSHPIEIYDLAGTTQQTFFLVDHALYESAPQNYSGSINVTFNVSAFFAGFSTEALEVLQSFLNASVKDGGTNILGQNQLTIPFTVTGTMTHPENIANSSYNNSVFFLSKKLFRQNLKNIIEQNYNVVGAMLLEFYLDMTDDVDYTLPSVFPETNQYLIKQGEGGNLENLENEIREYFASKSTEDNNLFSVTDETTNPWSVAADTDVKESVQLCYVFPMVFFLVAVLVILTTLSQLIVKERGDIGTLKAIGVSKGKIYAYYITITEIILFLASLIGAIVGPIILPMILANKYDILYSLPTRAFFYFPTVEAIVSTLIFMAIGALVTYIVARKELSLAPVESMRPKSITFKKGLKTPLKVGPFALSARMAFRNIRVNIVKSLMVIIGVLGCTALCVCGFGIDDTLDNGINVELTQFYNSDIMLTYAYAGSFKTEIEGVAGVTECEEYYRNISTVTTLDSEGNVEMSNTSYLYLFDEGVEHVGFKPTTSKEEVTISHKIAETYSLSIGDSIRFTYGDNTYERKVGQIVDLFATTGVFAYFSTLDATPSYLMAWVECEDGYNPTDVAQSLKQLDHVQGAATQASTASSISSVMSGISTMTMAVKVFAILLAVVVLYNLALMNYKDRTRDIATLKVLGFRRKEIALSLILETMVLTIIGALLGLLCGYPFMYLVLYVNRVPLVDFLYCVNPISYVISFAISVGVGFLVSGFLALLTNKVPMVESLKSVE